VQFSEHVLLLFQECEDSVVRSIITLRNYNYPHYYGYSYEHGKVRRGIDYVQWFAYISSYRFVEPPISIWRMYQSGQFLHFFALMEDYSSRKSINY
jgi:hypothetical protein